MKNAASGGTNRTGQTLLESLIALTIIAAAALTLLAGVTSGANVRTKTQDLKEADESMRSRAEEMISGGEAQEQTEITVEINGESHTRTVNKTAVSSSDGRPVYEFYFADGEM